MTRKIQIESEVCLTCGDFGFPEAVIYCVKCRAAEHSYCLGIFPETNEDVIWTCENCLSGLDGHSTFASSSSPIPLVTSDLMCIRSIEVAQARKSSPTLLSVKVEDSQNAMQSVKIEDSRNGISGQPEIVDYNALPIRDPIWRGSFRINNENFGTVNGLAAHLSTLACSKVCEAACLLPVSLALDMLPRIEVLPKRFVSSSMTDGDIGLYFFPEKERDEPAFDKLLDGIIDGDLAMKVVFDCLELDLFSSHLLPIHKWSKLTAISSLDIRESIICGGCLENNLVSDQVQKSICDFNL